MSYHTKLYDYDLPLSSINQNPYRHPEESSLLIAESKKIIKFDNFDSIISQPSLFIFNSSKVRNVRIVTNKLSGLTQTPQESIIFEPGQLPAQSYVL